MTGRRDTIRDNIIHAQAGRAVDPGAAAAAGQLQSGTDPPAARGAECSRSSCNRLVCCSRSQCVTDYRWKQAAGNCCEATVVLSVQPIVRHTFQPVCQVHYLAGISNLPVPVARGSSEAGGPRGCVPHPDLQSGAHREYAQQLSAVRCVAVCPTSSLQGLSRAHLVHKAQR